jgi:phosphatidate cytidylyltransferase
MSEQKVGSGLPRDLGPRLASGVVLGAVALLLTWAGPTTFALLVLAVALLVAWEWGRIVRRDGLDAIFAVNAVAVLSAGVLALAGLTALGLLALAIGAILAALLGFDRFGRVSAFGVLYSGVPAVSLIWIRSASPHGFEAALFILTVVWAADTGAYFIGRMVGGPKLMPAVSPNKTWSGFVGGLVASVLVALALAGVIPAASTGRMVMIALLFAVVAQAGDLMESALKRWHGVKDASSLIPGHGGFMDRVDGLIFVAVAAALIAAWSDVLRPAAALLTWR